MLRVGLFGTGAATVARRAFHISPSAEVRQKHLRRLNRLHKHWAKQMFRSEEEWVDPVLGKPAAAFITRVQAMISQRENQIGRLTPEATSKLLYKAERAASQSTAAVSEPAGPAPPADEDSQALNDAVALRNAQREAHKREAVLRIVSLQNSNKDQSQKQAIALARQEFERFPGDTGSPEVQAAVATIKIQFVAAHAKETKKDLQTKRRLEHMVQLRRNILLYLRKVDPRKYIWTIEKLGLSDSSVSAEFHMSRQYLWRTQFYGDKTLPMKKTVKDTKKTRELNAKRAKAQRYLAQHDPDALIHV